MDGRDARGKPVTLDNVAGIFIVAAIRDDEFHFVLRPQSLEVDPVVLLCLTAARALHVEYRDDRFWYARRAAMPSRLEEHRPPPVEQRLQEGIDRLLEERLAPGDLDQRAAVP